MHRECVPHRRREHTDASRDSRGGVHLRIHIGSVLGDTRER